MQGIDRRGEWVSLLGLVTSLAGAVILGCLAIWSQSSSTALWAATFLWLGTAGIWLLCYVQLHQQTLLTEERLEVAELQRQRDEKLGGTQTIFEEEDLDQMDTLAMGRRLRSIERFLIPVLALGVAIYYALAGLSIFPWAGQFPPIKYAQAFPSVIHAEVILFFTGGMAFVAFMASRYALGMSRLKQWSALRAGGNFLFGASATCLAISIALLCEISGLPRVESWLGRCIGFLLILLAIETVTNFILDFYRPRVAGEPHRPFYDSRLLGMFSEPGGILRSLANAIDYQFGFKVSETWFYKLLGRAVLPLLLVQIVIFLLLSCLVVVPPGHQAVIEHFGLPLSETAKSGIHVTWPWPIDRATTIPVERIQRMVLGHDDEEGADAEIEEPALMSDRPPVLWTKRHFKSEYQMLVADRQASADAKVPVNLLSVSMPIQWRVRHDTDADVIRFHAQAVEAAEIIRSLAYRELTHYAANADISDLLGTGGIKTAGMLQERLQTACDRAGSDGRGLGVDIVYLGIGGVHPPPDEDVAKTYEEVVSAIETKDAAIMSAQGEATRLRIASGGIRWQALYDALIAEDKAVAAGATNFVNDETLAFERLLQDTAGGRAREIVALAGQHAYERLFSEKSAAESYALQLVAYDAAPHPYLLRIYLRMITEALRNVRKYVIVMDDPGRVIYELDLKPPGALDVLGGEIAAGQEASGQ
jgi:regulator of protease activity HflC (stomatin/prohibitin superfamily)